MLQHTRIMQKRMQEIGSFPHWVTGTNRYTKTSLGIKNKITGEMRNCIRVTVGIRVIPFDFAPVKL